MDEKALPETAGFFVGMMRKLPFVWRILGKPITAVSARNTLIYYWDTQDRKAITLLKWAVAALGAKVDDGGMEGRIRV